MSVKKFPITSANGDEYLAHVSYYDSMFFGEDTLNVDLYIKSGKKLFGGDKFTKVGNSVFEKESEFNTNIIGAVKQAVSNYEHSIAVETQKQKAKKEREDKIAQSVQDFLEWNGECK